MPTYRLHKNLDVEIEADTYENAVLAGINDEELVWKMSSFTCYEKHEQLMSASINPTGVQG